MSKLIDEKGNLLPNWDFYNEYLKDREDVKRLSNSEDELLFNYVFEEDNIYNRILKNIERLKEGKYYRVKDEEMKEAIKEMMEAGFLPDIVFNDDFGMIKRQDTEFIFNLINGKNGIKETERTIKRNSCKKAV